MSDDFYIGYRKTTPPALARFVRASAIAIVLLVVGVAGLIGALQRPAGNGRYELGTIAISDATLVTDPVVLAVVQADDGVKRPALLVARGKHGPHASTISGSQKLVRFAGTRIERDGVRMIELAGPRRFEVLGDAPAPEQHRQLGNVALEGELIDTKCYLGVMNPAQGKVHRGCAAVCLRGGVPPGLLIRDPSGGQRVVVLSARGSGAPVINPEWAGRVVRATGIAESIFGLPVLHVQEIALR